jgi:hypothetical protein
MRINGRDIFMTRGDTERFEVSLYDLTIDIDRPFLEGDTVYFTVKTSTQTKTKLFQKVVTVFQDGIAKFTIEPENTKDLRYHEYVYDVQMVKEGDVTTIIPPSKFVIEEEVTYEPEVGNG